MTAPDLSADPGRTRRDGLLAETFVALADTLVDDYDVVELLDRLVASSVDLLGAAAAGLLLDDQRGRLTLVASSNEQTRLLEIFQLQTNEGPCLECVRTGVPVVCPDLAAEAARWPRFVPRALEAGFGSVMAVPLRLREQTIGGLNLFNGPGAASTQGDRRLAQALADIATIGILQQRSVHRTTLLAEQLQHALTSRIVIEQAKGVLAERHDVSLDIAFETLRAHARRHNLKLTDVALAVTRGELVPPVAPPRTPPA